VTVWAHRFMVVPDAQRATARALCLQLAPPPSADGLFTVGLSATGTGTPTHWISSGDIDANFAALLGNAAATLSAYQGSGGATVTLAQIQALYAAAPLGTYIRSDAQGTEQACMAALGLKLIQVTP
jgi:hypothetical protein